MKMDNSSFLFSSENTTAEIDNTTNIFANFPTYPEPTWHKIEAFLYTWIILVIACFGVLGNILNLLILSSKALTKNMSRMESSVNIGLMALAVSDLMFCVAVIPTCVLHGRFLTGHPSITFELVNLIYGDAVVNTFETASTWLTVSMAFSRFMVVRNPIHSRMFVGKTFARINITIVYVMSLLFNLPRFFIRRISTVQNLQGETQYSWYFWLPQNMRNVYEWCHFVLCVLTPFFILAFCNVFLIREVKKRPSNIQHRHSTTSRQKTSNDSKHLLTLTLTLIVVFYIIFVTPAEVLSFARQGLHFKRPGVLGAFNITVAVTNTLKTLNFAINFTLYCAVNGHFRKVMAAIFCCRNSQHAPAATSEVNNANSLQNTDVTSLRDLSCYRKKTQDDVSARIHQEETLLGKGLNGGKSQNQG